MVTEQTSGFLAVLHQCNTMLKTADPVTTCPLSYATVLKQQGTQTMLLQPSVLGKMGYLHYILIGLHKTSSHNQAVHSALLGWLTHWEILHK